MEDFNLHLTGDVHAIGAAHNLAAAFLDNSLHHKNPLGIDPFSILWPRVVDISDRAVRRAIIGLGGKENGVPRETEWIITVGSEVMAVLALATDLQDLRARLGRIVLATTTDGKPVTCEDIGVAGSMTVLLVDAIKPNLLQTLEGGPGVRPLRAVREHRPRQQLDHRRPARARHERDRLHRGRLRRRHGRREVLRHQVPRVGARAGRGGRRRHGPRAEDAWRRRARSWPASHSIRRSSRRTSRPFEPGRATSRSRSRTSASSASRPSSRSTRSRRTRPAEVEAIKEVALAAGATARGRRDPLHRRWPGRDRPGGGRLGGGLERRAVQAPLPGRRPARREDPDDRDEGLRGRRDRAAAGGPEGAQAVRGARVRAPAGLHGEDPVLAERRREPEGSRRADSP